MRINCAHCGKSIEKPLNEFNRAKRGGFRLFCDRRCAGLGKRIHKTKAQKVAEKRAYDIEYRLKNKAALKAKKREYFQQTYDPEKARIERKKRAKAHNEYCRQPWYKEWKKEYDKRRTDRNYGPFAEANRLLMDLNSAIKERATNEQIKWQNQTANKAQSRRRAGGQTRERTRPRFRDRRDSHSAAHGR